MQLAAMGEEHSVSWKKPADLRRQMKDIFHKALATGYPWAPVACWAVLTFLLSSHYREGWLSTSVRVYVIQPLLWLSLAFMGFLGWRFGVRRRPVLNREMVFLSYLAGLLQIAVFGLAGLVYGFGNSPYSHRLDLLVGNLFYAGSILLAVELSRATMVSALGRRRPILALAVSSLFFSFLSIPPSRWQVVGEFPDLLTFVGGTFLPLVSENLLASCLALLGGPVAALIYRGLLMLFEWVSPVLPNLDWIVTALLGTLTPALCISLILHLADLEAAERRVASSKPGVWRDWLVVAFLAVGLLWFNSGFLGVRPSVISGVSMKPALEPGDLVITRDVDPQDVTVGDMIRFRQGDVFIIHRVIWIEEDHHALSFITQGDANNVIDEKVPASNLQGKVILTIPKIGWVSIGARRLIGMIGGVR